MFLTPFIAIQVTLLLFMALHDWIDIPPYTDIDALKKHHTAKERVIASIINGSMVAIPLILTFVYMPIS